MLEHFCVFTKSGIVLWEYNYGPLKGDPVNDLIKCVLLEERLGQEVYHTGSYAIKWVQDNQNGLIYVV